MVTTLKDGSKVADKRLDRLIQFDERSRQFPLGTSLEFWAAPLRTKAWRCTTRLDQGSEGACVGFGLTHELISAPVEVPDQTYELAYERYKLAQRLDPWPGEDYEGTSLLAGLKAIKQQGWCEGYRWAFRTGEILTGISYIGPAILGTNVYEGMMYPEKSGRMKLTGELLGGHCWLWPALNMQYGRVYCLNSWGRDWGIDGCAYMTFKDFGKLMAQQGEAAFLTGQKMTP